MLLCCSLAIAQEADELGGSNAEFSVIARAEYLYGDPLGNSSLYATFDGSISDNLTYSFGTRLLSSTPGALYANSFRCLAEDDHGSVWAGTLFEGLARLAPDALRFRHFSDGFAGGRFKARDFAETPDGRTVYREQGEMLFTHFGVSGPLVLSASAHMRDGAAGCVLHIDLKPALDEGTLDARILRDFSAQPNRDLANVLGGLVNRKMIPVILRRLGVPGDRKIHDVTREERKRLVSLLKDMTLYVTGPRPISEAIVTSGGVDTAEVDPRTMESKRVRGLYFAGEILNCDAYTGGFNLQIAWSTAHAAATHVACG